MNKITRKKGEDVYQVITYLTESEKYKLKTHCAGHKITMSKYIKNLIAESLNK